MDLVMLPKNPYSQKLNTTLVFLGLGWLEHPGNTKEMPRNLHNELFRDLWSLKENGCWLDNWSWSMSHFPSCHVIYHTRMTVPTCGVRRVIVREHAHMSRCPTNAYFLPSLCQAMNLLTCFKMRNVKMLSFGWLMAMPQSPQAFQK